MEYSDLLALATSRRCIRRFKPDPISDDYIEKMINVARWAQSGGNAQSWEFLVVKNQETKNKIRDLIVEQHDLLWSIEQTRAPELRHPAYRAGTGEAKPIQTFAEAPVFIVMLGDPRTVQATVLGCQFLFTEGGPFAHFYKNMANATQMLNLAATSLGLGAMWVSVSNVVEPRIKQLLDVPVELAIHTIVPVGYPAYKPAPTYRRNLKEIIHYEKYDRSRYRTGEDIVKFLRQLRSKTAQSYPQFEEEKRVAGHIKVEEK